MGVTIDVTKICYNDHRKYYRPVCRPAGREAAAIDSDFSRVYNMRC